MLVIDSHLDLSWNALNWNRDFTLPVAEIRRSEAGMNERRRGRNTVCFPEMRQGDVGVCLATVLARSTRENAALLDYRSQEIASAMGHGQRTYYRIMEERGELRMLKNRGELSRHVDDWNSGSHERIGYILAMEGADPILSPDDAARWFEAGLRVVGLSHYSEGIYAGGTTASSGLTPRGFELLAAFKQLGMIVDATHLADAGFWEVTEKYEGDILASHNNCRALVPGPRQFSDDQIRKLIERGAVIGAAFDSWMLHPGYVPGETDNSLVSSSPTSSTTSTTSASWPATPATSPSAATSTEDSAASSRRAISTLSPTCKRFLRSSSKEATATRMFRASCTATGCASSGKPCRRVNRGKRLAPGPRGCQAGPGVFT